MNCVGCERCRLWGKIQVTGIGTALKILFSNSKDYELRREELVSFFNTLGRVSESIVAIENMEHRKSVL